MDKNWTYALMLLPFAFAGGFIGYKLRIPAGTLLFSFLAVAAARLLIKQLEGNMPAFINFLPQVLIGLVIGQQFTRGVFAQIAQMWGFVLFSVLALVIVGVISAILLIKFAGFSPSTAYISTSPGTATAMIAMAIDQGVNVPMVSIFHLTRIFFILMTGPIILKLVEYLK
jgi:uncharacterized protein